MVGRIEIPYTVQRVNAATKAVSALSGASVQVRDRVTNAQALVYSDESGSTTLAQPLVSDSAGRIEGWLEPGSYKLVVSGAGIDTYAQALDVPRQPDDNDVALQLQAAIVGKLDVGAQTRELPYLGPLATNYALPLTASDGLVVVRGQLVTDTVMRVDPLRPCMVLVILDQDHIGGHTPVWPQMQGTQPLVASSPWARTSILLSITNSAMFCLSSSQAARATLSMPGGTGANGT